MSIQSKVVAGCAALLIAVIGALQLGVVGTFIDRPAAREPAIHTDHAHLEVMVVEARRIPRG